MSFPVTEIIRKKRAGESLREPELRGLVEGYLEGTIRDYHLAAFLMAVCFKGMTVEETRTWTRLLWHSGITLPRTGRADFWVDKHSTGGVGDKTSLLLVPLVHCVGERLLGTRALKIPMISGRGLDFSGGTLDKLDSVPGFSSKLPMSEALPLLDRQGFFMMGQTEDLAPADRLLYALRDVTATTDCVPLIVSSILSKKLAENLDGLVLDVKFGAGAFMRDVHQGRTLARALTETARAEGVKATAFLTPMSEPLGWTVGNQLEVEECADFLVGIDQEKGLRELTLALAAEMISFASRGKIGFEQAVEACAEELDGKAPRKTFEAMFSRQGGDWAAFEARRKVLEDRPTAVVTAPRAGFLSRLDALSVAKLVRSLGGGRQSKESGVDLDVGVRVFRKVGDRVEAGETIFEVVYSRPPSHAATWTVDDFVTIEPGAVPPTRWIEEVLRA